MFTRRQLLTASAFAGAAWMARPLRLAAAPEEMPLPIPKLIDTSANGNRASLVVEAGEHAYFPERPVRSYGYSSGVLGPAIRIKRGQPVELSVENKMPRATTVHWHGLAIPGNLDGGPHNPIASGETWKINLAVDQPECTAWFHPHPHGETARQVYSGLAGIMLVADGTDARTALPNDYGNDDLPLILQDRIFDRSGSPIYDPGPMDTMAGYRGDTVIVNGVVSPVAPVPPGLVRLRLLNGANARIFELYFSDRRRFHVIASDGGYLPAPVAVQRLRISPGERYEIVTDFSDGRDVFLETGPDRNIPMMGMMRGADLAADGGQVIRFRVDSAKRATVKSLPEKIAGVPRLQRSDATVRRQFVLNEMTMGPGMGMGMGFGRRGGMPGQEMTINGRTFSPERIDFDAKRETLELWQLSSHMMAHPFHVHGTQFQILTLNGETPPPRLQGWKDTVLVDRYAEILVPITQTASRDHPFMFHCHILEHEDAGMMGQFSCI
jgi:FtsP/CotA-like multicopper oxidase with cupredoxin domain